MGNTLRTWTVPTDAIRLKAVRLSRKYLREGYGPSKARKMASKDVGYSVGAIYTWEKQFPLKNNVKNVSTKQTTTTIHSYKHPTNKTTKSTSLNGVVVNHNLDTEDQFRVLSVDLITNNGNVITLTERLAKSIVKIFG